MNTAAIDDPLAFPPFTRSRRVRAELLTSILRSGRPVPDEAFDEVYPESVREASPVHWTPVRVAVRVAALLQLRPADRLLDVGAGVGKFCIVVAALSGARVRGVERHPRLADVGREAARRLGVDVDLADGTLEGEDPRRVDVAYFYNPFTEPMVLRGLDSASTDRFSGRIATDVAAAERFLAAAPLGMKLVTFCGFGGSVPAGYHQLSEEVWEMGVLELWEKRDRG